MYLLTRKTVAGGLSAAFIVLLGLGLWYGWRGASYLWAAQWTVYAAGILFLWAWLAVDSPTKALPRWELHSFWLSLFFLLWLLSEGVHFPRLLSPFPHDLPSLRDIGILWSHEWAVLFAWLSVFLSVLWVLVAQVWEPRKK
ncbi:MAG: hypothetical protein N2170_06145 [Bacteroidia bacterium]|nr:hypothetical protein [Bacteroidia bacterium]